MNKFHNYIKSNLIYMYMNPFYVGKKTGKLLRRVREDPDGNIITQYVRTTPGRVIFNKTVQDTLMQ